ncbi:helix-turn-helix domain-containing protein [Succiniclasticum ruminis]|uniref:Helix-turn-helix n=1 Tax=Succiniclasticum ruminis DSM 9236 TaxID=1123323 RepID=A0A1I2EA11_9FIRM|nr:helix-turn-helix transcriptional regulator [Succiniclasticum ruminis]SFE89318.1 Helix-turn-helix [Succiniclasticum ruminis DSM 9236]
MNLNYKHIGRRIRQERIRNNLSQEKLAEMTDSSPQYISHIETGRKKASLEMLVRIANALDVTADQLIAENLTASRYRCDAELSRLIAGCSSYERRIILDIALATRYSLEENRWLIITDKS